MVKKFSQFPDATVLRSSDTVVGLRDSINQKFTILSGIADENGNWLVQWQPFSAVDRNYVRIVASPLGLPVAIQAQGIDEDVGIDLSSKNNGNVFLTVPGNGNIVLGITGHGDITLITHLGRIYLNETDPLFGFTTDDTFSGPTITDEYAISALAIKNYITGLITTLSSYTYITNLDHTAFLPNSDPLSVKATGFLSSINTSGIVNTRVHTGTANQITILNGSGEFGDPTYSFPAAVIFPDTIQANTVFVSDDIVHVGDTGNKIEFIPLSQSYYISNIVQMTLSSSGATIQSNLLLNANNITTIAGDLEIFPFGTLSLKTATTNELSLETDAGELKLSTASGNLMIFTNSGELLLDNVLSDIKLRNDSGNIITEINTGIYECVINLIQQMRINATNTLIQSNLALNANSISTVAGDLNITPFSQLIATVPGDLILTSTAGNSLLSAEAAGNVVIEADSGNIVVNTLTGLIEHQINSTVLQSLTSLGTQFGGTGARITSISDDTTMAADSSTLGVTQHASKTYADTVGGGSVTLANSGTESLVNDGVGPALAVKGLVAGSGITFQSDANDVTITNNFLIPTQTVGAGGINMVSGNRYIVTAGPLAPMLLPATSALGEFVIIDGFGATFSITQNAGQRIVGGNMSTTIGVTGSLDAGQQGNSVKLVCIEVDTTWITEARGTGGFTFN